MKKILLILIICAATYQWAVPAVVSANESISSAFESRLSDIQVSGTGHVIRILPDDNKGSRHQKFILRLGSGQTILVAHNIDLAPRINSISKNDEITFFGEYEWNEKGGVVHWTHKDPNQKHISGWLKHNGRTYQ